MAIIITDDCINCGACEPECPNTAIYEAADDWRYADGTSLEGNVVLPNGKSVDANEAQEPVSDEIYYIVPDKCTECKGFHDEPQCAAVCPVDCCLPDPEREETEAQGLDKAQCFPCLHHLLQDCHSGQELSHPTSLAVFDS